jgi:hypothetical protein
MLAQHVHYHEARFGAQQARACAWWIVGAKAQRLQHAAIGEHRIKARQLLHADLAASQHERETVMLLACKMSDAGALQELIEIRRMQLRGDPDGRNVAAAVKRIGRGDRAQESSVEILRGVGAERSRHVAQHGLRMQDALVEAERIDERLQGRAGRAARQSAVHLSQKRAVEIIGRADQRLDAHVARVDENRGRIVDAVRSIARDISRSAAPRMCCRSRSSVVVRRGSLAPPATRCVSSTCSTACGASNGNADKGRIVMAMRKAP